MSVATLLAEPPDRHGPHVREWPAVAPAILLTLALGLATVVTLLLSNGSLGATLGPLLLAGALWLAWAAPLRTTLAIVMCIGLVADRPGDAQGLWSSPLNTIGGLLFYNLSNVIPLEQLRFSGVTALLGLLLGVRLLRVMSGRVRDTEGSETLPAPLRLAIGLAVTTVAALVAFGLARGGEPQAAKMQTQGFLQLLAVAYLFGVSLRGTRDLRGLYAIVVFGACAKAVMALWVRWVVPAQSADRWGVLHELEFATSHGDSLLFAFATAVLVGPLFHRPTRRQTGAFLLLMPLIVAGVVANDRRIAWVQIAFVVATYFVMNPHSRPARLGRRFVVLASPLLLLYTAVGWSSASRVFSPVSFVRALVQPELSDGSLDRSTLFRDFENYNLVFTLRSNPVLGLGFGHPFRQATELDALPDFDDYPYLPHNSVLGLWAFTGAIGFTGLTGLFVVAMFLAARAHRMAAKADQAIAAAIAFGMLAAHILYLWADIGFTEIHAIFLVGLPVAMAGQMAVVTGAWPAQWRRFPAGTVLGGEVAHARG